MAFDVIQTRFNEQDGALNRAEDNIGRLLQNVAVADAKLDRLIEGNVQSARELDKWKGEMRSRLETIKGLIPEPREDNY